ncbi:MAG: hypothetical protein H7331_05080 [Bacteroidia bacterium]|nr:hypothetical protein [Bacteroidia bacterium]
MKSLTTTLLLLTLLTACSKNRTYRQKGQVVEIANWRFDKSIVPVAGVTVCMGQVASQDNFLAGSSIPTGVYNCTVTDADGKFNVELAVTRKGNRKYDYVTYVPQQPGIIIDRDYSSGGSTLMQKKTHRYTMGVYKRFPVVITLNNVNYLNNRDSLRLEGGGSNAELIFMGKQQNAIVRNVFRGDKSSANPTVLGGVVVNYLEIILKLVILILTIK